MGGIVMMIFLCLLATGLGIFAHTKRGKEFLDI